MLGCGDGTRGERVSERRIAILDAAEALFLDQGFERTSVAAIVARSGGSLATIYAMFGNKHGLLRAVANRREDDNLIDPTCEILLGGPPRDVLREVAHRLHDHFTAPRSVAMMRLVIAEALRDREFARAFHQEVRLRHSGALAEVFRRWIAQGLAEIDDAEAAAELFFATVLCDAQLSALAGIDMAADIAEAHRRIDWRLAPFISHFAIGG